MRRSRYGNTLHVPHRLRQRVPRGGITRNDRAARRMSRFPPVPVLALERDPQRELNGTREIGLLSHLPEPRRREIGVRQSELSMVEQVENLSAELHSRVLRKVEVLAGRKVPVVFALRSQSRIDPALISKGKRTRLSK